MFGNDGMKTPFAFAEALKGQIVGPANDPANPEPVEPQRPEPLRAVKLADNLKGTVLVGNTSHVAGDTIQVTERRAYDLVANGFAIAVGVVDWFVKPFKPKPKTAPFEVIENLNEHGAGRDFKVESLGTKGVFRGRRTYVGTLYLSESDARACVAARVVKLIEPKVLPPVHEKTYTLKAAPNGASMLIPTA
jgi:hypothetical protein